MRIITGSAKGARLETLDGLATRPTAERVKEAVFSMLQFDIEGRNVLDLFAGSGQLGFEALSRGAEKATFADISDDAVNIVRRNAEKLKMTDRCRIVRSDYAAFIKKASPDEKFHIVFLDPPYADGLALPALEMLVGGGLLAGHALIVAESGDEEPIVCEGVKLLRHSRYGKVFITLTEFDAQIAETDE